MPHQPLPFARRPRLASAPLTRLLLGGAATIALLAATRSPAYPCTAPAAWSTPVPFPADGATEVPTNARISAIYEWSRFFLVDYQEGFAEHLALRDPNGAEIAVTRQQSSHGEDVVETLIPAEPLQPGVTYELVDHLRSAEECQSDPSTCLSAEPTVVSHFTTGSGPDLTPPSFAGPSTISSTFVAEQPGDPCGPFSNVEHTVEWTAATDDGPADWIRYNVYDGLGTLLATNIDVPRMVAADTCTGTVPTAILHQYYSLSGGPTFRVHAVDLAGNEDLNDFVLSGQPCEHFDYDGDGQLDPVLGHDEDDCGGIGGCSASGSAAGPLAALAALGLVMTRRRRRATR